MPVFHTHFKSPVMGIDGEMITQGAIGLLAKRSRFIESSDPDALNEFYRQVSKN